MIARWWIYQKERFPLAKHAPMVALYCLSVLLFSALQQAAFEWPDLQNFLGAFVSTLLLFFQLRVADEFKDYLADCRYRPHRAVPRGVLSLRALGIAAWCGAAVQFAIAVYLDVGLVPLLLLVWIWLGLMTREFFVAEWLRARPLAYLFSHMLIMPLITLYISAFDWLCECRALPGGLLWLLAASFCVGLTLELGRKIRMPDRERRGVETYSAAWGPRTAVICWFASVVAAVIAATVAVSRLPDEGVFALLAMTALAVAAAITIVFLRHTAARVGSIADRAIEPGSGLVALALYLGLGPLQALLG